MKYFETVKIPTSHVFQNHLDEIHHTIEDYCKQNKRFTWVVSDGERSRSKQSLSEVESYLRKNQPKTLKYLVISTNNDEKLYIEIKNGVVVNVKNGNFALYGLFYSLTQIFSGFKVPLAVSFIRRYWVVLTPLLLIVSGTLLWKIGLILWAWVFIIALLFFAGTLATLIFNDWENETFNYESYLLNTKIGYKLYSNRLGVPINVFLRSTSSIITLLASLATIVTAILFLKDS